MGCEGFIESVISYAVIEGRKMAAGIDKYLQANRSAKKSVSVN
jgi:hypothetical protein